LTSPDQTDNEAASLLEQAITRSKQGDAWAFRGLVESYQHYAFSLAFRIVCDADDAHDIVQEAFIRVWKHIRSYLPEVKFTTWLYRIVVNLSYDRLKGDGRRKRLFMTMAKVAEFSLHDASIAIDTDLINRDLADKITAIAQGLPLKQRMVFVLRDLQDLSVGEVAEILEISHESVKTNLCYARRHIRRRLERLEVQ
jgi:RNA polymerase sigma-70 factor (ECF subfamily)